MIMNEGKRHMLLGSVLLFTFGFCVIFGYLIMDVMSPILGIFLIIVGIQALVLRVYLRFKRISRLTGKREE